MNRTESSSQRLATRILWGLVAGIILGSAAAGVGRVAPGFLAGCQFAADEILGPLGQIFLRLLFFVVVPLVFASLALGVTQLENLRKLGPLAVRTGLFFVGNMAVGVVLGLVMMNLLKPGGSLDPGNRDRLASQFIDKAQAVEETRHEQPGMTLKTFVDMFMPRNLLKSVVEFQILPMILFSVLFGAAGTQIEQDRRARLQEALETLVELMTRMVQFALALAPYAVPMLVFSAIVKIGLDFLVALLFFVGSCLAIMALHLFGTMSLWLRLFSRRSPREFFRAIRAVLVTAFSTSSSSATLPTSLQISRDSLGVSPSTSGFVLPLGATMNMSGTALYEGCVVLFIAQVYGVDLALAQQVTLLVLTVFSAVAVAGIPGGSLPLIAGLLMSFGIPAEGLAFIIGVDRILDMARTTVNVGADIVTAVIIDDQLKRNAA